MIDSQTNGVEVLFRVKAGVTKAWVCRVIENVLRAEKTGGSVDVLITGDREIHQLNKRFLNHDCATDVISFGATPVKGCLSDPRYLGDIVVSVDTARRWAKELGIAFREELARYLIHGTLHLLGYDDRKKKDKKCMHRRQEEILIQSRHEKEIFSP